ncbi:MAG: hypothetical protein J4428_03815 [Candidatus Aenigmarchaeota archaeon]|nr:hypothetical protein [Candidatus Aenigmarchaeota archaeon]
MVTQDIQPQTRLTLNLLYAASKSMTYGSDFGSGIAYSIYNSTIVQLLLRLPIEISLPLSQAYASGRNPSESAEFLLKALKDYEVGGEKPSK